MKNRIYNTAGREYGHVPGHQYHDVEVSCAPDGTDAEAIETWGSAQGYDEEHGRQEISAASLDALHAAATDAGWDGNSLTYLATAITRCRREIRERAGGQL